MPRAFVSVTCKLSRTSALPVGRSSSISSDSLLRQLLFPEAPQDVVENLAFGFGLGTDRAGVLVGLDVHVAERLERPQNGAERDIVGHGIIARLRCGEIRGRELDRLGRGNRAGVNGGRRGNQNSRRDAN